MDSMLPMYNTKTFTQIFPTFQSFKNTFDNDFGRYAKDCITENSLIALYWLLYSRYGESPIVNLSENIFKSKIVATTFQKGPTWERRLKLQQDLRELSEADLLKGARTLLNRALHPETEPGTNTDEELDYLNQQDVSKLTRSKLDAYSFLQDVLKTDVTEEFLESYRKLFSRFVSPTNTRIYVNDIEEDN